MQWCYVENPEMVISINSEQYLHTALQKIKCKELEQEKVADCMYKTYIKDKREFS